MSSNLVRTTLAVCATALAAAAASATAAASQASPLIAFISDRDGSPALWTMATDGSNQHRISDQTGTIRWTGDGRFILVSSSGRFERIAPASGEIMTVEPAFDTVFSPDGSHVTFLTGTGCAAVGCTLVVAPTDGSRPTVLTDDSLATVDWSPDGHHVVYVVGHGSGTPEIWSADENGANRVKLLTVPFFSHVDSVAWLADGSIAYIANSFLSAHLFRYVPGDPPPAASGATIGEYASVDASPDGTALAVQTGVYAAPDRLTVSDLTDAHSVAPRGNLRLNARVWAPDGSGLAYAGCDMGLNAFPPWGPCRVGILDLGTWTDLPVVAGPETWRSGPLYGGLTWAPDSAGLAVSALDAASGTLHIATFDRDGSNLFWLTSGDQNDTSPVWQPAVPEPPTPPTPGTDELAPNPGFEGDVAADWRFVVDRGSPQHSAFGTTTQSVHGGSQAVCINGDSDDSNALVRLLSKQIPVNAGHGYHFSAYLRGLNLQGEGRIDLTFWDANGAYIPDSSRSSADYGQTVTGTSGWTQVALDERAPDNAATVRLEIRAYGAGSVCADDASLTKSG